MNKLLLNLFTILLNICFLRLNITLNIFYCGNLEIFVLPLQHPSAKGTQIDMCGLLGTLGIKTVIFCTKNCYIDDCASENNFFFNSTY